MKLFYFFICFVFEHAHRPGLLVAGGAVGLRLGGVGGVWLRVIDRGRGGGWRRGGGAYTCVFVVALIFVRRGDPVTARGTVCSWITRRERTVRTIKRRYEWKSISEIMKPHIPAHYWASDSINHLFHILLQVFLSRKSEPTEFYRKLYGFPRELSFAKFYTTFASRVSFRLLHSVWSVTCVVQVSVGSSVPRAQVGGAGVAFLGFRRANTKAPYLAVRTIHHLHELPTPEGGQQHRCSDLIPDTHIHQKNTQV